MTAVAFQAASVGAGEVTVLAVAFQAASVGAGEVTPLVSPVSGLALNGRPRKTFVFLVTREKKVRHRVQR